MLPSSGNFEAGSDGDLAVSLNSTRRLHTEITILDWGRPGRGRATERSSWPKSSLNTTPSPTPTSPLLPPAGNSLPNGSTLPSVPPSEYKLPTHPDDSQVFNLLSQKPGMTPVIIATIFDLPDVIQE
eukprot:GHVU01234470.1.p2 GENE.GHVU01234470.1~~GHVU01234470.1.p2  ORF type:complete len:127 (-),score=11.78 GHVU01234470.1:462-842(-)